MEQVVRELGLTYGQLAGVLGVSDASIRDIVKGRAKGISVEIAMGLVEKFGVNLNWLYTGEGPMRIREMPDPGLSLPPRAESILRLLRENPGMAGPVEAFLQGGATMKELVSAAQALPAAERRKAVKLVQALGG